MGDLHEFSDRQTFGRARIEIGCDTRRVIVDRIEIGVIGIIADLDIRVIDDAVEMHCPAMRFSVRQNDRMTRGRVEEWS